MDTIANMLTAIRNASAAKKEVASFSYSKMKMEIVKILVREKFIKEAERKGKKDKKIIDIAMIYDENGKPAISHIKRVSKQSRRIYLPVKKIKQTRQGFGIQIISTPKGILTNKEAKKEGVGGELICEVW